MRRTAAEVLAAVLLLVGSAGWGQQLSPPPQQKEDSAGKSKLEEMLIEALRNNPDIRVAAAKVSEAEAELNRTRLRVAQRVIALHHQVESQRVEVKHQQEAYQRALNLYQRNSISREEMNQVRGALTLAKTKLAELEAEVPYLTGKPVEQVPPAKRTGGVEKPALAQLANRAMAAKIRRALDQPVRVQAKDKPTEEVLKDLLGKIEGVPHTILVKTPGRVTLDFENISLGAALQALRDYNAADWVILVREYGLLVSGPPLLPPNAVTLEKFWKSGPAAEGTGGKPERVATNPPPEQVKGVVDKVDPKSGLITLSIGPDAGLAKGHTLEVYRLKPTPKYLGTVRVLDVTENQAVARPVGRLASPPQPGDRASSRVIGGH